MPLVRIDLKQGKDAAYRQRISQVVYESMTTSINVPAHDNFQLITEHSTDNFVFDLEYLGVHRSSNLIIIQITLNEGRTLEAKRLLYKTIADGLVNSLKLRREDVFITLVETKKEDWSFGNGIAQYAA